MQSKFAHDAHAVLKQPKGKIFIPVSFTDLRSPSLLLYLNWVTNSKLSQTHVWCTCSDSQNCQDMHLLPPPPTINISQWLSRKNYSCCTCLYWFPLSPAALVPGQVQNLRSALDPNVPSLTLNWDKPNNVKTAEEVTAYDIRFRPAGSLLRSGYHMVTVDSPAASALLTRENGLNPQTRYDFEVRAWNADHCEGKWSKVSKYIGRFNQYIELNDWYTNVWCLLSLVPHLILCSSLLLTMSPHILELFHHRVGRDSTDA